LRRSIARIVLSTKRQQVFYTLTGALQATGLDKVTILRAIEGGKIAAAKDLFGEWQIECAALHQVFPPVAERGSRNDATQRCAAPGAASLEAEIGAIIAEAGYRLRRRPDDARQATQATRGSSRESASEAPPIDQIYQIGIRDSDQRFRIVLTTGALLVAVGLGWVGGLGSNHFFAPPSYEQMNSALARNPSLENETICITRPETGREAIRSAPNTRNVVTPTAPSLTDELTMRVSDVQSQVASSGLACAFC
jgi:hypothetical protein